MQDRRVRRRWGATLVGSVAVLALAAGCTGDDGVEVIADDRDPMDVLAAAAESLPTSGRIHATIEMDMSGWMDLDDDGGTSDEEMPSSFRSTVDMEFNGDRSRVRSSVEPDLEELGTFESEVLQFGDAAYVTAASLLDYVDPEKSGEDALPEDLERLESARRAIGDRRWVRFGEDDAGILGMFALWTLGAGAEGQEQWLDPATIFEELTGVTELDPIVSDGTQVRVFRGTYEQPGWSAGDLNDFGEPYSEEEAARIERIEAYGRERAGTEVVVHLDEQGRLRRIETTSRDDVEEQYRDCMLLFSMGEHTAVIEYSDFGADIAIEDPDPATVIDVAELAEIGDLGLYLGLGVPGPDDESEWSDEGTGGTTTTALGPEDLASMLRDMHGPTLSDGAALIGLDPATIPTMTEDEILDAVDRLDEARQTQPKTQTALGLQDRIGMLELIRAGVDMLGLEPLQGLEAMTDQQLAELIDNYVAANGAPVGAEPGEWSPEDYEDPAFSEDDEDYEDYDEFEGCPA